MLIDLPSSNILDNPEVQHVQYEHRDIDQYQVIDEDI
jgi:hypothetical protein